MIKIGFTYYTAGGGANSAHVSETYLARYAHANLGRDPSLIDLRVTFFFPPPYNYDVYELWSCACCKCTATIVLIYHRRSFIHTFHLHDSMRQINGRRPYEVPPAARLIFAHSNWRTLAVTQAITR